MNKLILILLDRDIMVTPIYKIINFDRIFNDISYIFKTHIIYEKNAEILGEHISFYHIPQNQNISFIYHKKENKILDIEDIYIKKIFLEFDEMWIKEVISRDIDNIKIVYSSNDVYGRNMSHERINDYLWRIIADKQEKFIDDIIYPINNEMPIWIYNYIVSNRVNIDIGGLLYKLIIKYGIIQCCELLDASINKYTLLESDYYLHPLCAFWIMTHEEENLCGCDRIDRFFELFDAYYADKKYSILYKCCFSAEYDIKNTIYWGLLKEAPNYLLVVRNSQWLFIYDEDYYDCDILKSYLVNLDPLM